MSRIDQLEQSDLEGIAALCSRAIIDAPSPGELEGALFAAEQPAIVFGDVSTGVVAVVECDDGPHVRLLAVDPAVRGEGRGHALMAAAEEWARASEHGRLTIGADPPYFLWPGVPIDETALLCLLERRHYSRVETNFNMRVDLSAVPADPGGHALAGPAERDEIDEWMGTHWSNWRLEVLRALDRGNLCVSRDGDGALVAFCAFEVNRVGVLGPVAVRPDLIGQGVGQAALLGALHELRRRGRDEISVVWVGPVVPYAAVRGKVTDVYFVYRKELG